MGKTEINLKFSVYLYFFYKTNFDKEKYVIKFNSKRVVY